MAKQFTFSCTEQDISKHHDEKYIIDCLWNSKDLFDSACEPLRRAYINEIVLPRLLQKQRERFIYIFNRPSSANAKLSILTNPE